MSNRRLPRPGLSRYGFRLATNWNNSPAQILELGPVGVELLAPRESRGARLAGRLAVQTLAVRSLSELLLFPHHLKARP